MRSFLLMFKEAVLVAVNALRVSKLRTFLSLLGICFGVFLVTGVFTALDSLEHSIKSGIESLGSNVVFVQKWPWEFGDDYPWWKYINRPEATMADLEAIQKYSELAETATFIAGTSRTVEYKNSSMLAVNVVATSHNYDKVRAFELLMGRYFTEDESRKGSKVAVIGYNVAAALFEGESPLDKSIKIGGVRARVIGVFELEGQSMIGTSSDYDAVVPINFAKSFLNIRGSGLQPKIMVKAAEGVTIPELQDELMGVMRAQRRLRPVEKENFALNEISALSKPFDKLFLYVGWAGLIVGGLALLVAGFAIANIMFVSVKERVNIIGIQKSLGAKRWFIMSQFLSEAIILCLIGGLTAILIVVLLASLISAAVDFEVIVTQRNVLLGTGLSTLIGLFAGILPAWQASRLNPVDAIRAK